MNSSKEVETDRDLESLLYIHRLRKKLKFDREALVTDAEVIALDAFFEYRDRVLPTKEEQRAKVSLKSILKHARIAQMRNCASDVAGPSTQP
jgi:hypothetical protein